MEETTKVPYVTLNNGIKMPQIGLGTFDINDDAARKSIKDAILELGYRKIDTAKLYNNEAEIGEVLKEVFAAGVKREELFITTKLWGTDREDPKAALKIALEKLKLEYVDCYMLHTPCIPYDDEKKSYANIPLHKTWAKMEALVKEGLAKSIGISNFNVQITMDLLSYAEIKPAVNQIELHPYLPQQAAVDWFKSMGIVLEAYSPLQSPGFLPPWRKERSKILIKDPLVEELAKKYGKSNGQILLNWGLARGHVVIPKSTKKERQKENLESCSFTMEKEDVEKLTALNMNDRWLDFKNIPGIGAPIFE